MMKFKKEIQIALVAIAGLVILFYGMQFLKGLTMFSAGNKYMATFDDVTGLSASSPVYCNGVKIGTVESIDYDFNHPDNILAIIGLDDEVRIPEGTTAEIVSDLLGNVRLELKLGNLSAAKMAVGDTIRGGMQQGVMGKAGELVPEIQQLLPKLDSILSSINTLLANPALDHSLNNIEDITSGLTITAGELNKLAGALNRQVPALMGKATGVMANADTLTRNLNAINVAATMEKVNHTLDNVERMTAKLNSNEGTLGLLMRDAELYNNLNVTVSHADSLMLDLKRHPKRYVHFSVFGNKGN